MDIFKLTVKLQPIRCYFRTCSYLSLLIVFGQYSLQKNPDFIVTFNISFSFYYFSSLFVFAQLNASEQITTKFSVELNMFPIKKKYK